MNNNFFSKENLQTLSVKDKYLSSLAKTYYPERIQNSIFSTLSSVFWTNSWKLTLKEMIKRFKELEDTHYPLEDNKETKFLSQKYIFPEGFDENFIWKCKGSKKFLEKWWLFEKILDLNPELKNLTLKNDDEKITLLAWLASRFPAHDIKYFIECLDSSCTNEKWNNEKFISELKNSKIWNIIIENKQLFEKTIEKNSNDMKCSLSDTVYQRITWFSSFEEYEQWVSTIETTKTYGKESDKEFEWLYIQPKAIFSFYHTRDNLNILDYPEFAYNYLKDYIEENYLTPNSYNVFWVGGFWYGISPKSLEIFIEKNKIELK